MDVLTLVTHQCWRADDLAPHVDPRIDYGFDLDAAFAGTPLWCPGAWAAAAVQANRQLALSSAGAEWLTQWSPSITGRRVTSVRAGSLTGWGETETGQVFAKLPETKSDRFPAEVRVPARLRVDTAALPSDEPVSLQAPVVFTYEVRCWVLDGAVVATAAYFPGIPREEWADSVSPETDASAAAWLSHIVTEQPHCFPPAVVVDVGRIAMGDSDSWCIVEANAAWSADWYGPSDTSAVVETIIRSQRDVPDEWVWRPSPLLVATATGLLARHSR